MTENNQDERLLEQFFQAARQVELDDDGFTERVMRRLPDRSLRLSRLWTAACIVAGLLLFTLLGGWQSLLTWGLSAMATLPTTGHVAQLWICFALATILIIEEILRREHILDIKIL